MIKKRNNGGGDQLVPWRVSSNQNENYKTNVPINATIISTLAVGGAVLVSVLIPKFLQYVALMDVTYCIVILISTFQMPLVVAFTVKHRKKASKVNPNLPKTLQFHEEDEKSEV